MGTITEHQSSWSRKRGTWSDPEVAGQYDQRRFSSPFERLKHRRDEAVLRRVFLESVRLGPLEQVLDAPCGTGRLLPVLGEGDRSVTGADLSLEMLGQEATRDSANLLRAECERLPFADRSFDAVVCMRFLFHVEDPAARAAILSELARIARRAVIVQVRWGTSVKHALRRLRRRMRLAHQPRPAFDRPGLEKELTAAGLELVAIHPVSRLFSDKALVVARPRPPLE